VKESDSSPLKGNLCGGEKHLNTVTDPGFDLRGGEGALTLSTGGGRGRKSIKVLTVDAYVIILHVLAKFLIKVG